MSLCIYAACIGEVTGVVWTFYIIVMLTLRHSGKAKRCTPLQIILFQHYYIQHFTHSPAALKSLGTVSVGWGRGRPEVAVEDVEVEEITDLEQRAECGVWFGPEQELIQKSP